MTEPDNSSIDNNTEPAVAVLDDTPQNQPTTDVTPTRMSILCLPPEIRVMIYHYVLRLPFHIPYDNPRIWRHPVVQAHTGILFTSRLIQREAISTLFSENTFTFQPRFSRISVIPSRRIRNMIRNFSADIDLPLPSARQRHRERFADIIYAVGDPPIVRGTFSIHFSLDPIYHHHSGPLNFFIRRLRRLTNFQLVMIDFVYCTGAAQSTAGHCDLVENALRSALGPATPYTTMTQRRGLTFHPQRFLNEQGSVGSTHGPGS